MLNIMGLLKGQKAELNLKTPLSNAGFAVIDTELTGLNARKDSIVSIGAVRMRGGRIDINDDFYMVLKPRTDLTARSVVIHEITPTEVLEQPEIDIALVKFAEFCGDDLLVGFCVDIDMEFLNREARRVLGHALPNKAIDIYPIFEWILGKRQTGSGKELPNRYRLYDIAKHYGIDVNGVHNAMIDAFIAAQIFQRFIPVLLDAGVNSTGDLLSFISHLQGGDRHRIARGMSNF